MQEGNQQGTGDRDRIVRSSQGGRQGTKEEILYKKIIEEALVRDSKMKHRETAYGLLRVTLGVIFLFYGVGKFIGGLANFVGGMNQHFSGKLPAAMVMPFAYAIPFCEVISGLLILLGLFTRVASLFQDYCYSD